VRLPGRPEVALHPEVYPRFACPEPHAASRREHRRLLLLLHAQQIAVERARLRFLPRRHRELDVVDRADHELGS
jgi:hypothetical protein